jgi:hypothetical protein
VSILSGVEQCMTWLMGPLEDLLGSTGGVDVQGAAGSLEVQLGALEVFPQTEVERHLAVVDMEAQVALSHAGILDDIGVALHEVSRQMVGKEVLGQRLKTGAHPVIDEALESQVREHDSAMVHAIGRRPGRGVLLGPGAVGQGLPQQAVTPVSLEEGSSPDSGVDLSEVRAGEGPVCG